MNVENLQRKSDDMIDVLVERGRRSFQDLSCIEKEEISGYLLLLQPKSDQFNYLMQSDEENVSIPIFIGRYLINNTPEDAQKLLDAIRSLSKNMFKDVIDKIFADYKYPLTDDQILENAQREHDAYGEL